MRRPRPISPSYAAPPTHNLYLLHQPLIGLPSFTPHLHLRVALHSLRHPHKHAIAYDLVPHNATRPSVLLAMLSGRCVPAETRVRAVRWPLKARGSVGVRFIGEVVADERVVGEWVRGYRGCGCVEGMAGIGLYGRNCWWFAERLVRKLREEELAGEDFGVEG